MKSLLLLTVFVVGTLLPMQAAMNANIHRHLGHPIWGAVWNFVLGLSILLVAAAVTGARLRPLSEIWANTPWWAYWGGACGVSLVMVALFSAPKLGAALLVGGLVAGQLVSSVLIDHMGWFGLAARPLTPGRMVGVGLLAVGVWCLKRF